MLAACPDLKVLVTSRAVLGVSGEHNMPVPPLALPTTDKPVSPEELAQAEAIALFVARAKAADHGFALTEANAADVAAICERLDGLPLAIELAAARVRTLSPPALLARLTGRLRVLTGGPREQPPRLRSLRDAVAWSYDLLSLEEQALFRRLAIFVDGCTLEAAEEVGGSGAPSTSLVLDLVASLVDKSLLRQELGLGGELRFRMLETIREFALERLAECDESEDISRRHAAFFLAFAERATPEVVPGNPDIELDRLAACHGDLRAAFDWLCDKATAEDCVRLAAACAPYWYARGHVREAWMRLNAALDIAPSAPTVAKGRVLIWASQFAITSGNYPAATTLGQEALAASESVGSSRDRASALHALAMVEEIQLHWDAAADLYDRVLAASHDLKDTFHFGRALALRAGVAYGQGDLDRAVALENEAGALFRQLSNRRWTGLAEWYLGMFAGEQRRFPDAARHYRESLQILIEASDVVWLFKPLAGLAEVAARCDRPDVAARLLGAVDGLLDRAGARLLPFDGPIYGRAEEIARAALGAATFSEAREMGRALDPVALLVEADLVVATAGDTRQSPRHRKVEADSGLTVREFEVLRLLAEGRTDPEIAAALFITPRTARAHVASILAKLGVATRAAAATHAVRHNLI